MQAELNSMKLRSNDAQMQISELNHLLENERKARQLAESKLKVNLHANILSRV